MKIEITTVQQVEMVENIVHTTISEIYPHYYPKGAVLFFLQLHSEKAIETAV